MQRRVSGDTDNGLIDPLAVQFLLKGTIAPGSDADIVLYDPHAEQVISAETHHMNVDYSAYEGRRITGRVDTVLSRGEVVIDRREYTGRAGHGAFVHRSTCQYL